MPVPANSIPVAKEGYGRVLIVGAAGFIGHLVAAASLRAGMPTYLLVRSASATKAKPTVKALQDQGAIIVQGDINDKECTERTLKELKIETVISAVGGEAVMDQIPLVEAIKAVGTIKRFMPSEFGHDVDRAEPVQPGMNMYIQKRQVRRLIEDSGVPYTYILCNSIASWPYFDNTHPSEVLPPTDKFHIYGDGSVKAYFVAGSDIGKFTIKALYDPRTLNKSVHFRPKSNYFCINELASLWESKIGRVLPRVTVSEDHLLALAAENRIPESIVASFTHDIFIKGCQINFDIEGPDEMEVGDLYPEERFITLDQCFNEFYARLLKGKVGAEGGEKVSKAEDVVITPPVEAADIIPPSHVMEPLPISAMCA
uniref:NmrA-like domain-containing protein n=1 Tax=Kalanchoe fedtschenkoi TaxID=63787 RepID=A0A7N0ZXU9_KALFE